MTTQQQLSDKDLEIGRTVWREFEEGTKGTLAERIARAEDLGASRELIGRIAQYSPQAGMPWVKFLLEKGYSLQEVRVMIEDMCFGHDATLSCKNDFLADSSAWDAFDDNELSSFLIRIAKYEGTNVAGCFKTIKERLGHVSAVEIAETWVKHNGSIFIHTDEELKMLQNLSKDVQIKAALRVMPDWRTIPFIVRALKYTKESKTFYNLVAPGHTRFWLLQLPMVLRWAHLGGERFQYPDKSFSENENDFVSVSQWYPYLRSLIQDAGWRFVKPELKNGQFQVVDNSRHGQQIVYIHNQEGPRGDRLKAGDEVMVPKNHDMDLIPDFAVHRCVSRKLQPTSKNGNIITYKMELHPVAAPTAIMLQNPEFYFRGEDIIPRTKK